jgi:heme-degrading monooxygenase HmoA
MTPPASLPEPPYVAVIFTSQRTAGDDDAYAAMAARMEQVGSCQRGFLGIESARDADGSGITVSYWRTQADAKAWKLVAEHLGAQELGRERWYERYVTRVAVVDRQYAWERDEAAAR